MFSLQARKIAHGMSEVKGYVVKVEDPLPQIKADRRRKEKEVT